MKNVMFLSLLIFQLSASHNTTILQKDFPETDYQYANFGIPSALAVFLLCGLYKAKSFFKKETKSPIIASIKGEFIFINTAHIDSKELEALGTLLGERMQICKCSLNARTYKNADKLGDW